MTTEAPETSRKLGAWLIVGIVVLPVIFAWFTLRRGHSRVQRIASFVWMAVYVLAGATAPTPVTAPSTGKPPALSSTAAIPTVEQLAESVPDIDRASIEGDALKVEITSASIVDTARTVEAIGMWLRRDGIQLPVATLRVAVATPTIDRLGREGRGGLMVLTFAVTDLREANFINLLPPEVLGLAVTARSAGPVGQTEIVEWCSDASNTRFTGAAFCRKALQS